MNEEQYLVEALIENNLNSILESIDSDAAKAVAAFKTALDKNPQMKKDYIFKYSLSGNNFVEQTKKKDTWGQDDMEVMNDFGKDLTLELKKKSISIDTSGTKDFVLYHIAK